MANLNTTQFRSCGSAENLRTQFNALRADVTAIRTALVAVTAKLDADGGVTDTDYNSSDPAALTSSDLTA
jgi:hypothetical protein